MSQYLELLILCVINGVFCALDLLLFYIFEVTLIPMFILIGIWGGPNKIYASTKFFFTSFWFFTCSLDVIYYETGTFDLVDLRQQPFTIEKNILFFAFFAHLQLIPMWPIHTWLPDAPQRHPPLVQLFWRLFC